MDRQEALRPYSDGRTPGGQVPHLIDYWHVVRRRWAIVFAAVAVTTAGGWWLSQRAMVYYRSSLSLQVNDPWQRTRSLTAVGRISATDVFFDPIRSEIEVLQATPIAAQVVDSLGLRLTSIDAGAFRSALVSAVRVDPGAEDGLYILSYEGDVASLADPFGARLGQARVGTLLDARTLRLVPLSPPDGSRRYLLAVRPRERAIEEVRAGLSATARESTNIVDVAYTSADPGLAPQILDAAAAALRVYGARRVASQAAREVEFIEQRLDSAYAQLGTSLADIRTFKESQEFTDLTMQEQSLVHQGEQLGLRLQDLEAQRSTLSRILRGLQEAPAGVLDLVSVVAELPLGIHPQLGEMANRLRERRETYQHLLTAERKTADHPEVRALESQIADVERELSNAVDANLRAVEGRLAQLDRDRGLLRARQREFPGLENRLETLELQQNLDRGTYEYLLSQLYQARITEAAASPYVDVLDPATDPFPERGPRRASAMLGLVLGLVLGLGGAFFAEYVDRTIRTSSDVHILLGIPVLGVIPQLRRTARRLTGAQVDARAAAAPSGALAGRSTDAPASAVTDSATGSVAGRETSDSGPAQAGVEPVLVLSGDGATHGNGNGSSLSAASPPGTGGGRRRRTRMRVGSRSDADRLPPIIVTLDPGDPAAEAYRTLRLNLTFSDGDPNGVRSVNFTSPGPNEGKSTSALNFAVLMAMQRDRVVIVDADLRRPAVHEALGVPRGPGLADVLLGQASLDAALRREVLPHLDVLPAGPRIDNPSELLNSRAMEDLLATLEERYNYVVVDSPPILAVTDAAVLAAHADGLVLVLRSGRTDQRAAQRAVAQLDRVGVRILGAVLNEVAPSTTEETYYFKYIDQYYSDHDRRGRAPLAETTAAAPGS